MEDTKRNTEILIPYGALRTLKEHFKVHHTTVTMALLGARKTQLADQIRKFALNHCGGNYRRAPSFNSMSVSFKKNERYRSIDTIGVLKRFLYFRI